MEMKSNHFINGSYLPFRQPETSLFDPRFHHDLNAKFLA